jgi:hypothetical protein
MDVGVFNVLQQLSLDNKSIFACTLWSLWKQRNYVFLDKQEGYHAFVCDGGTTLLTGWRNGKKQKKNL